MRYPVANLGSQNRLGQYTAWDRLPPPAKPAYEPGQYEYQTEEDVAAAAAKLDAAKKDYDSADKSTIDKANDAFTPYREANDAYNQAYDAYEKQASLRDELEKLYADWEIADKELYEAKTARYEGSRQPPELFEAEKRAKKRYDDDKAKMEELWKGWREGHLKWELWRKYGIGETEYPPEWVDKINEGTAFLFEQLMYVLPFLPYAKGMRTSVPRGVPRVVPKIAPRIVPKIPVRPPVPTPATPRRFQVVNVPPKAPVVPPQVATPSGGRMIPSLAPGAPPSGGGRPMMPTPGGTGAGGAGGVTPGESEFMKEFKKILPETPPPVPTPGAGGWKPPPGYIAISPEIEREIYKLSPTLLMKRNPLTGETFYRQDQIQNLLQQAGLAKPTPTPGTMPTKPLMQPQPAVPPPVATPGRPKEYIPWPEGLQNPNSYPVEITRDPKTGEMLFDKRTINLILQDQGRPPIATPGAMPTMPSGGPGVTAPSEELIAGQVAKPDWLKEYSPDVQDKFMDWFQRKRMRPETLFDPNRSKLWKDLVNDFAAKKAAAQAAVPPPVATGGGTMPTPSGGPPHTGFSLPPKGIQMPATIASIDPMSGRPISRTVESLFDPVSGKTYYRTADIQEFIRKKVPQFWSPYPREGRRKMGPSTIPLEPGAKTIPTVPYPWVPSVDTRTGMVAPPTTTSAGGVSTETARGGPAYPSVATPGGGTAAYCDPMKGEFPDGRGGCRTSIDTSKAGLIAAAAGGGGPTAAAPYSPTQLNIGRMGVRFPVMNLR